MDPFLFTDLSKSDTRGTLEKPILYSLRIGLTLLGSRAHSNLSRQSVQDAVRDIEDGSASLNLHDPPLVPVHDLLPLGWSVLRVQVTTKVTTILLAVKHKYFVLEISVPILEGITADDLVMIPTSAIERPHVKFDPKN
ncbi:putative Plastocyanin-like domain-containing protein [Seiridium unicorne]|uniref:Plastocyanin-like domain-containing protein n=1 Tax=Seiridium unicorne TaxID=138068 RepID=A0ABR2VEM2_9PEZI